LTNRRATASCSSGTQAGTLSGSSQPLTVPSHWHCPATGSAGGNQAVPPLAPQALTLTSLLFLFFPGQAWPAHGLRQNLTSDTGFRFCRPDRARDCAAECPRVSRSRSPAARSAFQINRDLHAVCHNYRILPLSVSCRPMALPSRHHSTSSAITGRLRLADSSDAERHKPQVLERQARQ
jgi:hypothetical protein